MTKQAHAPTPIAADDPLAQSAQVVGDNLALLKTLFPETFTEGQIDFEVLKQLLGGAVNEREEKFGLNWHGKRRARQLALTPSTGTLRPCPEDSVDWDTTQNLMLEGDNLEVLKLLQKSYAGKVKLIYIDPPYNTGKDFVYPDDFQDNIKNYLIRTSQIESDGRANSSNVEASGRFHTDWLNMLYPRLKVARNLLCESGIIFISIDDKEHANLLKLCDEVFGCENFVGNIVWQTATDNNPRQIAVDHEYIVCYVKNLSVQTEWVMASEKAKFIQQKYDELLAAMGNKPSEIESALRAWIRAQVRSGDSDLEGISHYAYVDEKGVFYPGNSANPRPGGYAFDILHPITKEVCAKPENGYRWPPSTFDEAKARGDVLWGEDHTSVPKIKKRLETATQLLKSSYYEDNRASTKALKSLMGEKVFDNPKSPRLLKHLFDFTVGKEDVVVDFFAGSGTTAEAVLMQNAEDQGHRRYVLVQLPEILDPAVKEQKVAAKYCDKIKRPRNIAELTKERLRRAAKKVSDAEPLFKGDLGFRVFKLDSSNIRAWDPEAASANLSETLLATTEHIKADRKEADILYELLLKLGLDLTVPIEKKRIAGKDVHAIGAGTLIVCLAAKIKRDDVEALAQGIIDWHKALAPAGESTVVFRDSGFEDDVAKSNLAAILAQHGFDESRIRSL